MDLFRRKQKLIFWIVTIIIVPSFVLVWGYNRSMHGESVDFEVGKINGESVKYPEFEAFRKRIQAAVGGMPLQFAGAPGIGTRSEELWKYTFAFALLQDAKKADATATDLQIGTYLENNHPAVSPSYNRADAKSVEKAVDAFCRQMQITRSDFLQGVREWQTIGNYIISDANLAAVNDDTVFTYYAVNNSECVVKRVRVTPTDAMREQAKKEVMEKPREELEKEAADYVAGKQDDKRFRTPAEWRFAYVMVPMVAESLARPATDQEMEAYYQTNRERLFAGKPFEDVKDQVRSDLAKQEIDRQTLRNFSVDVDPQLRAHPNMPLDDLARLTPLAKYGVKAGVTGDKPAPAGNVAEGLPAGVDPKLLLVLDLLDSAPEKQRNELIANWKAGFDLTGVLATPLKADEGFIRLHLLDYIPSSPATLKNADGSVNQHMYETAIADMVADRVDALVREKAIATEADVRQLLEARKAGNAPPDAAVAAEFDSLPSQTIPYLEIADSDYALGRLVVGEMMGPNPFKSPETGASGQELVVMVDRRVPTRAAFDAEPADLKNRYRTMSRSNYQGNFGFTYTMSGPAAIIQPSPAIMGDIADRYTRGEITVNPELLASTAGEG